MKFAIGCVVLVAACGGDDGTTIDNFGERVIDLEWKVAAQCGQVADEATCKANATLRGRPRMQERPLREGSDRHGVPPDVIHAR